MLNDYGKSLFEPLLSVSNVVLGLSILFVASLVIARVDLDSSAWASWVQAIGSIVAILAAVWISNRDSRERRKSEAEARRYALERAVAAAEDAGRRVSSSLLTFKKFNSFQFPSKAVGIDLEQALGHLKEVQLSPGIDSKMFTQLFIARTAIEDISLSFTLLCQAGDYEEDALEPLHNAVNRFDYALEKLTSMQ